MGAHSSPLFGSPPFPGIHPLSFWGTHPSLHEQVALEGLTIHAGGPQARGMGIRPSKAGQNASPGGERGLVFWEGAVTTLSQQIAGGQSPFQVKGDKMQVKEKELLKESHAEPQIWSKAEVVGVGWAGCVRERRSF